MQRTTFNIEDDLLGKIRERAARERRSMGDLVNSLLRGALKAPTKPDTPAVPWNTFSVGEVSVDINDRDALDAVMTDK